MSQNYKEFRAKQQKRYDQVTEHFDAFCECAENETEAFRVDIPNGYWVFTPTSKKQ